MRQKQILRRCAPQDDNGHSFRGRIMKRSMLAGWRTVGPLVAAGGLLLACGAPAPVVSSAPAPAPMRETLPPPAAAPAAPSLPQRLSDADFWKLESDISEPGGYFQIEDNYTSNE